MLQIIKEQENEETGVDFRDPDNPISVQFVDMLQEDNLDYHKPNLLKSNISYLEDPKYINGTTFTSILLNFEGGLGDMEENSMKLKNTKGLTLDQALIEAGGFGKDKWLNCDYYRLILGIHSFHLLASFRFWWICHIQLWLLDRKAGV